MPSKYRPSLNQPGSVQYATLERLVGGVNNSSLDIDIAPNEVSDAYNWKIFSAAALSTRDGIGTYGDFIARNATNSEISGGWEFENIAGTREIMLGYTTALYRYVSGKWTALTGATMTAGVKLDGCFFPFTNKFYVTDGTTNIVKYTSGTSADQTDASFKKGKYIVPYQNRLLVANVSGQENRVWYTDNQVDTFSANNYFEVDGPVVGMLEYNNYVFIFTNHSIYRLQNFRFDGTQGYADTLLRLPCDFGLIADRSIVIANNKIFFAGTDPFRRFGIYWCDGYNAYNISEAKITGTIETISPTYLTNFCAVSEGDRYRLWVTPDGNTKNDLCIIWDDLRKIFVPFEDRYVAGLANPSIAWTAIINGQNRILIGSQTEGQVYILNDNETGYDALPEEEYSATGVSTIDIRSNPIDGQNYRAGQSFKLGNYNGTATALVLKVSVKMNWVSGTGTALQMVVRSTSRTGTIVATSTSVTGWSAASGDGWKDFVFTSLPLTGNTTYYLEVKHVTEGPGNSRYTAAYDTVGTYTDGNVAIYNRVSSISSVWNETAGGDLNFRVYVESIIDSRLDTMAFHPATLGFEYKLRKFLPFYGTTTEAGIEVGFSKDGHPSYTTTVIQADTGSGATWGGSSTWGGGALWGGAQQRQYKWYSVDSFQGHSLKVRIRNRQPNKTLYFEGIKMALTAKKRMS